MVSDYLPTQYWLMKTEPDVFSFSDLLLRPDQTEKWDGVRSYQARNFMRDHMQVGHKVLFYHSNANPTGIVGTATVVKAAEADLTALDSISPYFDVKSTLQNPRWVAVTIGNPVPFKSFVSLAHLRLETELADMLLLRKGQRLSVLPLSEEEFLRITELGE